MSPREFVLRGNWGALPSNTTPVVSAGNTEVPVIAYTIPAGTARVSTYYRITGWGMLSTGARPAVDLSLIVRLGAASAVHLMPCQGVNQHDKVWRAQFDIAVRTAGATGEAVVSSLSQNAAAANDDRLALGQAVIVPFNTTADAMLQLGFSWPDGGTETATCQVATVEVVHD